MQLIFSKTNKIARARREIIFHDCAEAKRANHLYKKVFQTLHIFSVKARTTTSNQNNHSRPLWDDLLSPILPSKENYCNFLGEFLRYR